MIERFLLTIDANGKILVGGYFTAYEWVSVNRIIRLNTNGSIDSSFNIGNGFDKSVWAIAIDASGKYVIGGRFSTYQWVSANKIIRLNTDWSRDTSFNMGGWIPWNGDDCVYSLAIDANGKIIITGYFNSYNWSLAYKIVRVNPDGSIDTTFNMWDGFGPMITYPQAVVLTSDGKIIILGNTFQYKWIGTPPGMNTINSDGSRDRTKQNITSGFDTPSWNGTIRAAAIQSDGKILVGGWFKSYNKTLVYGLVRLNSDGSRDTTFDIWSWFDIWVYDGYLNSRWIASIAVQADGKILVGWSFTTYQWISASKIIRLNADGSRDTSFNIGVWFDNGQYTAPTKIIVQPSGKILVVGSFTSYQWVTANKMIRLNADGSIDSTFNMGAWFVGSVVNVDSDSNGKIIAIGQFTSYNWTPINQIAIINSDWTLDTTFNPWTSFASWYPYTVKVQADGKILVGWHFSTYKWVNIKSLIRLNRDASLDSSFIFNNDYSFWSNDVTLFWIQNDGKILVNIDKFYRLNQDWSLDTSFLGKNDTSFAWGGPSVVLVWPDWNIFIWWNFTSYKWISKAQMIRLNGTYVPELPGSLPVFLSDTQIIAYLLKTKKTVDPKWLFMGTIPLYF